MSKKRGGRGIKSGSRAQGPTLLQGWRLRRTGSPRVWRLCLLPGCESEGSFVLVAAMVTKRNSESGLILHAAKGCCRCIGAEASASGVGEAERYFKEHLHSAEAKQVPVSLHQTQPRRQ